MNPSEHVKIKKQVNVLLQKIYIYIYERERERERERESLSLCVIPALLTPKKDGSWRICVDSQVINRISIKY
jgi:hypothetical protein